MNLTLPFDDKSGTIQAQFEDFHREHPEVYQKLCEFARGVKMRGYDHYGIGALWERVRWHFTFDAANESFKANNNFRSRYARKIMAEQPDLAGFFELRELRAE